MTEKANKEMHTKPKLLVVADTYYPKLDGTLRFMEEFVKRAREFEVSLLVPRLQRKKDTGISTKVHHITYIEPSKHIEMSGYPSLKISWSNLTKIKQAIKAADIVFVQGPALISYLSLWYGRKYKKKTSFYTHTISWELIEKFFPPLLNRLLFNISKRISIMFYNRCDEIFVPYHDLQRQLSQEGVTAPIKVARLGVDINLFSPSKDKRLSKRKMGIEHETQVIGYLGRISKEKNIEILLEAFKRLEGDVFLLMIGDGPEDQKAECNALRNCKITGFVTNPYDYLKAVDVFVMPSLTETTSLSTLEAMSTGLPVIATKVGFMKKYISKDHNGLFFPRNSSQMLAAKIQKLLGDAELRERLGKQARKTVAYSFSWERSINKIKRLLLRG